MRRGPGAVIHWGWRSARRAALLAVVVGGACSNANTPRSEPLSVVSGRGPRYISLASTGAIIGPTMSLAPTASGYRGMADSTIVDLRCDGERIVGVMWDRLVELHLEVEDEGLRLRGMLAGRLGHLFASNYAINSTLGRCSYELEAVGDRYEGKRACYAGLAVPIISPAAIELPPGFAGLSTPRQAMLLALLLSQ
jgi:hypothetical protein